MFSPRTQTSPRSNSLHLHLLRTGRSRVTSLPGPLFRLLLLPANQRSFCQKQHLRQPAKRKITKDERAHCSQWNNASYRLPAAAANETTPAIRQQALFAIEFNGWNVWYCVTVTWKHFLNFGKALLELKLCAIKVWQEASESGRQVIQGGFDAFQLLVDVLLLLLLPLERLLGGKKGTKLN